MVDAVSMATQLANWEVYSAETRVQTQLQTLSAKRSALSSINSQLSSFNTLLDDLTGYNKSVVKNSADSSNEELLTAQADAGAQSANYQIFVEQLAQRHQLSTQLPAGTTQDSFVPGSGVISLQLGGDLDRADFDSDEEYESAVAEMSFEIDLALADTEGNGELSYLDLVTAINNDPANIGISASLVQTAGDIQLLFSSDEPGAENQIRISSSSSNAVFDSAFDSSNMNELLKNQDAIAWLGAENTGLKLQNASNEFEDVISGVDFTLHQTHSSGDTPLTLQVGADQKGTNEALSELVTKYNAIMSEIEKYSATGNSEEGESRGVLASDSTTRSIKNSLRAVFQQSFDGVTTTELGFEFDRNGTLSFDSDTFAEFQSTSTVDIEELFRGEDMLLSQLQSKIDVYNDYSTGTIKSQIDSIDAQKTRANDKLDSLDRKYEMYYSRYLKQYSQLSTMQSEMDNITSMFAQY